MDYIADMSDSMKLHDEKYKTARAAGQPGWGGAARIAGLSAVIEERFFNLACLPRSGRLLELGCGAGNLSIELAIRGYEVFGIDFSKAAIAWAKENAMNSRIHIEFQTGNIVDLSRFETGFFDIVYDGNCIHCIIGDDRQRAFQEIHRVLKPNGIFFVSSLCSLNCAPAFPENFNVESRTLFEDGVAYRYIPVAQSLENELLRAGFEILKRVERQESPFGHVNIHGRKTEQ